LSLLGHMGKLIAEGRVTCDDEMPVVQSNFQLVEVTA
jgi:hypothetical protein